MKSRFFSLMLLAGMVVFFSGCDKDDPEPENIPEVITKVILAFTPNGSTSSIQVTATDPDGEGPQPYALSGPITLARNTTYSMSIGLLNELAPPSAPEYNVGLEVLEEKDEHMFFFAWTNTPFSSPSGNGNIPNRSGVVNYQDEDDNNLPVGLVTSWTTVNAAANGTFRVVLKHQPDIKSATSTSNDGETDLDVAFNINVN